MWIPPTVPASILRFFSRKLSSEKYEAERKKRPVRSEDPNWDKDLPTVTITLVGCCIKEIAKSYSRIAAKVDASNRRHRARYDASMAEWEKKWLAYEREMTDYHRIIEEHEEFTNRISLELGDDFDFEGRGDSFGGFLEDDWEPPEEPTMPPMSPPTLVEEPSFLTYLSTTNRNKLMEAFEQDNIPIDLALRTIADQHYWRLFSQKRFPEAAVEEYHNSWKRVFVEKSLRQLIEFFHPREGDWAIFEKELRVYGLHAKGLEICQLIPKCFGIPRKSVTKVEFHGDEELVGGEEDVGFRGLASLQRKQAANKRVEVQKAKKKKQAKQNRINKAANEIKRAKEEATMSEEEGKKAAEKAKKLAEERREGREDSRLEAEELKMEAKEAAFAAKALKKQMREDRNHVDMSRILPLMKRLRKLTIMYKMQAVGLDFDPRYEDCTWRDSVNLAKGIKKCPTIQNLEILRSNITDRMTKVLCCRGIRYLPHLRILNFSYNNLGDDGAKAIAHLITDDESAIHCTLHTLNLTRCQIGRDGAKAIGYALTINRHLRRLSLRLNPIQNGGGKAIANGLVGNNTLIFLDLSGTNLGASGCILLGKMLLHNSTLREVNFSSNPLIPDTAAGIVAGAAHHNKNLLKLDFRSSGTDAEMVATIESKCHDNFLATALEFPAHGRRFNKKEATFYPPTPYVPPVDEEEEEWEDETEEEEEMEGSATSGLPESPFGFPKMPPLKMPPLPPPEEEPTKQEAQVPGEKEVPKKEVKKPASPMTPEEILKEIRSDAARHESRRRLKRREVKPFALEERRIRDLIEDYDEDLDQEFYESWLRGERLDKYIEYLEGLTKEPPTSPLCKHRYLKDLEHLDPNHPSDYQLHY